MVVQFHPTVRWPRDAQLPGGLSFISPGGVDVILISLVTEFFI